MYIKIRYFMEVIINPECNLNALVGIYDGYKENMTRVVTQNVHKTTLKPFGKNVLINLWRYI